MQRTRRLEGTYLTVSDLITCYNAPGDSHVRTRDESIALECDMCLNNSMLYVVWLHFEREQLVTQSQLPIYSDNREDVESVQLWIVLDFEAFIFLYFRDVTCRSEDGLSAIATKLGTPLMLDSYTSDMCLNFGVSDSYHYMQWTTWFYMLEVDCGLGEFIDEDRSDVSLTINAALDSHQFKNNCSVSSYARVMIELRADVKLKDNFIVAMLRIEGEGHYICAGEKKTVKKPSQTSRGVPVGQKIGFKPQKEYRPVTKKATASSSGGTTNLVNNEATLSGSSFVNVDNSNTSTTPIIDKIRKFEELLTSGKAIFMDEAERVGFGTQSLLEQWRDSYDNGDYNEDPYDDDMYEGQDLSQEILAICDNLDIRVRGRKKK
ncbi:hypothetical protein Tco_0209757 [Tanacetum coccineum]